MDEDRIERFTTAKSTVTIHNQTYEPRTIKRSNYILDSLVKKNNINITFPGDDEFALEYIHPTTLNLTVIIATLEDIIFYRGRLVTVRYESKKITMVFEQQIRLGSQYSGERRVYQRSCPYELYGDNCKAKEFRHEFTLLATLTATTLRLAHASSDTSDLTSASAYEVLRTEADPSAKVGIGRLVGGLLYIADKVYWITKVSNPQAVIRATPNFITYKSVEFTVTTFRAYDSSLAVVGDTYHASFGCLRTTNDCRVLHDNIANFGGFAGLSRVSPFKGGLRDRN